MRLLAFCYHSILAQTYSYAYASLPLLACNGKCRSAEAQPSYIHHDTYFGCNAIMAQVVVAQPSASFAVGKLP